MSQSLNYLPVTLTGKFVRTASICLLSVPGSLENITSGIENPSAGKSSPDTATSSPSLITRRRNISADKKSITLDSDLEKEKYSRRKLFISKFSPDH